MNRFETTSRRQRIAIVSILLLGVAFKVVYVFKSDQAWNKELVSTVHTSQHKYDHYYFRRGDYNTVERDGDVVFDSRKDGPIQGLALIDGVACKQFYDASKNDTGCAPLP